MSARLTYFDVTCPNCGPFHHNAVRTPRTCPQCGCTTVLASEHDYGIDARFKIERERNEDAE